VSSQHTFVYFKQKIEVIKFLESKIVTTFQYSVVPLIKQAIPFEG